MAMGRRKQERQGEMWISRGELPQSPGRVFYEKLNGLLAANGFDAWAEELCLAYYAKLDRTGIPPGTSFRMLLLSYVKGIGSQRGVAWRCADSLSLRKFLGLDTQETSPDHSSLTIRRDRLPLDVHVAVFQRVLSVAREKNLLQSIVRKESGENWQAYLMTLMREAGIIAPDDTPCSEEMQRFDKSRAGKKDSNTEWESPVDPDSRIKKMKDGTTHRPTKPSMR
jgi:transposase